jgi:hypothetical protein
LSGSYSNHSSTRSWTDIGSTRSSSVMSSRPNERNLRPSRGVERPPRRTAPASRSGGGSWYRGLEKPGEGTEPRDEFGPPIGILRRMMPDPVRRVSRTARQRERIAGTTCDRDADSGLRVLRGRRCPCPWRAPQAGGNHPASSPSGAARNPGWNSSGRPTPPIDSAASSTSTRRPALPNVGSGRQAVRAAADDDRVQCLRHGQAPRARISSAASRPDAPMIPPPGCVPAPHCQ